MCFRALRGTLIFGRHLLCQVPSLATRWKLSSGCGHAQLIYQAVCIADVKAIIVIVLLYCAGSHSFFHSVGLHTLQLISSPHSFTHQPDNRFFIIVSQQHYHHGISTHLHPVRDIHSRLTNHRPSGLYRRSTGRFSAAKNGTSTSAGANSPRGAAAINPSHSLPDHRIAQAAVATDFKVLASVFKSAFVKGDGLVFSDLIEFPTVTQSLVCYHLYSAPLRESSSRTSAVRCQSKHQSLRSHSF